MSSWRPISAVLILGGGILTILSHQLLQVLPPDSRIASILITMMGIILFVFGVWSIQRGNLPRRSIQLLTVLNNKLAIKEWQVVLLILSIFYAILVPIAAGTGAKMYNPGIAMMSWIAAIGCAVIGGWQRFSILPFPKPKLIIWAVILTTIAFLPRGVATDRIPILLTGDEGSAGIAASSFLNNETNNIFKLGWFSFPNLYFFLTSISISVQGRTIEALRIPSALAGALTVTVVYFVGRAMFDKRTGMFAALFLAAYHFHIHFSRIGLNNIWDGLFYVITIGALWYGLEKERRNAYILAGFSLGFAQYFYPSARTLFALTLVWLLVIALVERQMFRRALPHLSVMLIVTIAVFLPLAWYFVKYPNDFFAPLARVSILPNIVNHESLLTGKSTWIILLDHLEKGFQAYTYTPIQAWYTPGTPLLLPFAAGVLHLGIILLLLRGGVRKATPLILWLVVFSLIGGLSESTPASQRYVAVAPACALLIGFGISESILLFEQLWPKRIWLTLFSTAIILLMAYGELNFYFNIYTPESINAQVHSHGMIAKELADYLQTQPNDLKIVFFGAPFMGYYSIPSIQYLNSNLFGVDITHPWGSPNNPPISGDHLAFVFLPSSQDQIKLVQADYPDGTLIEFPAVDGSSLFWLYDYHNELIY